MKRKLILTLGFVVFTTVFCMFRLVASEKKSDVEVPKKENKMSFYWAYGCDSHLGINPAFGGRFFYDSYGVDASVGARFAISEYELEGNLNFLYSPFKSGLYLGIGAKGGFRNIKQVKNEDFFVFIANETDEEMMHIHTQYKEKINWSFSPKLIAGKQTKNAFYQVEIFPFTINEVDTKIKENPSACLRVGHFF